MAFSVFEMVRESAWMRGVFYALLGTMALPVAVYAAGMVVLPFLEKSKTNWAERWFKLFCRLWTMAGVAWGCLMGLFLLGLLGDLALPVLEAAGRPEFASVAEKAVAELFGCGMLSVFFGLWVIFWTHSIGEMNKSPKLKAFGTGIMIGCGWATAVSIVVLIAMAILRTPVASLVAGILLGVCAAKAVKGRENALEKANKPENPLKKDDESRARWAQGIAVACGVLAVVFILRAAFLH